VSSLGPVSSIPHASAAIREASQHSTDPTLRGGDTEPSEVMLALMGAQRAWAKRYCPWTLEEWLDA
jgi:hypothetical protein